MFTVSVDIETTDPLTETALERAAELGGVATGRPGGRQLGATMTVEAPTAAVAGILATDRLVAVAAGVATALEVLTCDEFDRRQALELAK
jgi:hypothetical protein